MSSEVTVLNEIVQEQRAQIAQLVSQVEELRQQFDTVLDERNEAMAERASARSVHEALVRNITSMSEFAGKAMRERDEARREVCKRVESASCLSDGEPTTTASDYARWCGWDCFKEDGKPCQ